MALEIATGHAVDDIVAEADFDVFAVRLNVGRQGPNEDDGQSGNKADHEANDDGPARSARAREQRQKGKQSLGALGEKPAGESEREDDVADAVDATGDFGPEDLPAGEGGQGHEENQQGIGSGDAALLHRLEAKRVGERGGETHRFAAQAEAPGEEEGRRGRSRQERREPRGEGVFAEECVGNCLAPVDERRLGVSRRVVESRYDVIAALEHFAAGFGEAGFVAIEQGQERGLRQRECQDSEEEEQGATPERAGRGGGGGRCVQARDGSRWPSHRTSWISAKWNFAGHKGRPSRDLCRDGVIACDDVCAGEGLPIG
jgi:hypothetical protein